VYDFRTNQHLTLKPQPLTRDHLDDFVASTGLVSGTSVRSQSKSLEEAIQIPPQEVLAEEIITTVSAALSEFAAVAAEFGVDLDTDI